MKRIFFANHSQFEGKYTNLGDWAIFEQMENIFLPEIQNGNIEIIVPSADVQYTTDNYHVTAFQRGGFKGIVNTLKWISKSDIVLIGGGEIVQDRSSLVYIPYLLIRPLIAKLLHKKLFAYAIGVGEKEEISILGKIQSRIVLNMFDTITVRDDKSYRILHEYLHVTKPRMHITADPALNLISKSKPEINMDKPFFVISVRSVYHRNGNLLPFSIRKKFGLVSKSYGLEINKFKSDIAHLAVNLMDKYNLRLKFLNTYTGKQMSASDDAFTADIISRIPSQYQSKIDIINAENTPSETKYVLGRAQFIISVPLHPLILGASEGVPVFGLAYASKNKCFMKQIGRDKNIYSVEKIGERLNVEKIISDISIIMSDIENYKIQLSKAVAEAKERERNNYKLLMETAGIGGAKRC